ncbi:transporter [Thalassotalea sp. 42_200_T64]|nr:transporter [Thalassotalea sp. 42_200_T64]
MFFNFGDFYERQILAKPKLVTTVIILISLFFASHISNFRLDASSETLVLENDASLQFYREIKAQYGSDDYLIMTFSPNQPTFAKETLDQLISLSTRLEVIANIATVTSILNVPLVNSPPISLKLLQQQTPTLLSAGTEPKLAREELVTSPLYRNLLISADSQTVALILNIKQDETLLELAKQRNSLKVMATDQALSGEQQRQLTAINEAYSAYATELQSKEAKLIKNVRRVMSDYQQFGQLHLGGLPMITADSIAFIRHDLMSFGVIVFVFIIITLAVAFSRLKWVLLPLITCVITGAAMVGFLGLVDWPVTVVSSNFISLMLILTLSLLIHLIVRYQELHWQNPQASQLVLVSTTLRKKLIPCIFTTTTTIIAFVSLMVSDIRPVIEFGWMMSLGITLAFIMVFTLFPVMMMQLSPGLPVNQQNITKRIVLWLANNLLANSRPVLVLYLVIVILSIVGVTRLTVENRFIDYFKKSTEIYQGMVLIDQKLGGTTPLDVIIDAPENSLELVVAATEEDDELLAELGLDEDDLSELSAEQPANAYNGYWFNLSMLANIKKYHSYLESLPQTGKVLSVVSGMALINQVSPESKNDDFTLEILYSKLPESVKDVILTPYISQDGDQIRFSIRLFESDKSLKRTALLNEIEQGLTSKFGLKPEQIKFSGMLVLYNNMLKSLFNSQIKTLGIVFFSILIMFMMMYKNFKLALITLIPNLVSAVMVLGIMGWAHVPLDIMTITIAAICVGIAVDNSIHYVHRFKLEYQQCGDYLKAMFIAHASIGRAMYYTSITITLGFSILSLSNFLPTIYFGLLTGFSMIVALLANLTLLPLLLIHFKPLNKGVF